MPSSFKIATISGIPIRIHITLAILFPLFLLSYAGLGIMGVLLGGLLGIGLFASITLHELAHAVVARHRGCHIHEILLLPIGGIAKISNMSSNHRDELWIALAGPLTSLALAGGLLAVVIFSAGAIPFVAILALALAKMNGMLAGFNLLPVFPMDGGRVFRAWLSPRLGRLRATYWAAKIGKLFSILFGIWAVFPILKGETPDFFLLIIAVFIYQSATAESRQVAFEEWRRENPY